MRRHLTPARAAPWAAAALAMALGAALPAAANPALCEARDTPFAARLAACEAVLATATDRAGAYIDIGHAYADNDDFDNALAAFDAALAEEPDRRLALVGRSLVLIAGERFEEAEVALRATIAAHPDHYWGHYRLGRFLVDQDRFGEALEVLDVARRLNDTDLWTWVNIAVAHDGRDEYAESGRAWRRVTELDPFDPDWHWRAWWVFRRAGMIAEAAYHARIRHTLDPNDLLVRDWLLNDFAPAVDPPPLDPYDWVPPPPDREIRYLTVLADVDTRDDTERAIEEMMAFFGGNAYPLPDTAAILLLGFEATEAPLQYAPRLKFEHRQGDEDDRPENPGARYYTMFPFDLRPGGSPDAPLIEARFDGASPADLWPLLAGRAVAGAGRDVVDCSRGTGFRYATMGCLPGVAEVGRFDWQADVTTARIHVPLGLFDTYKLDLTLTAELSFLGVTRQNTYAASYWIAPEVDAWIARVFTVDDRYAHHQAMEILTVAQQ